MSDSQTAKKIFSTFDKTKELALLMRENPSGLDRSLLKEGHEIIGFFKDENYGKHTKDFTKLKNETLQFVIDDVGLGGYSLLTSKVGILIKNGSLKTFINPLGQTPDGNVILSFTLKNRTAFQKFRKEANEGMDQETVDKALYFLAHLLSENLD
jgi:hypothetical protein